MKLLDRYVARAVIGSTALVLTVLLALFGFFALLDELDDVGEGHYRLVDALAYVALTLPRESVELFPVAALLGSLLGLGALAGSSELTVFRAAGVSVARIAGAVMGAGAVLMVLAVVVGEALAPPLADRADRLRGLALESTRPKGPGLWSRDGDSFVHIDRIIADDRVAGVRIFELDTGGRLRVATRARRGFYRDGAWHLEDVRQTQVGAEGVVRRALPETRWGSALVPELLRVARVEPERMGALDLWRYVRYLEANGQDAAHHAIALAARLVTPLTTGVMILLAIPAVLGPLRAVSVGSRILVGALAGLGFHIVNESFRQLGVVYDLSPLLAAGGPTAVAALVALWLLRRVR